MVTECGHLIYSYLSGIKQVGKEIPEGMPGKSAVKDVTATTTTKNCVSNAFRNRCSSELQAKNLQYKSPPPVTSRKPIFPPTVVTQRKGTPNGCLIPRGLSPPEEESVETRKKPVRPLLPSKPNHVSPSSLGDDKRKPLKSPPLVPPVVPPRRREVEQREPYPSRPPRRKLPGSRHIKRPPQEERKRVGGGIVERIKQQEVLSKQRLDSSLDASRPPVPIKRQSLHKNTPSPPPRPPVRPSQKSPTGESRHSPSSPDGRPEVPPRHNRQPPSNQKLSTTTNGEVSSPSPEPSGYISPISRGVHVPEVDDYEYVDYPSDEESRVWRSESSSPDPLTPTEGRGVAVRAEFSKEGLKRTQSAKARPRPGKKLLTQILAPVFRMSCPFYHHFSNA